ncbi:VanZ family protein [Paraglaciecola sp. L3A3]|uniref:VanZ family protein n=1 Tax=Paraglaciecola sp. L3A3 TaxID=2686358 RepID=UPI00131C3E55|nr:VanZ family protein [Paraglaciecola sp. L3A3]
MRLLLILALLIVYGSLYPLEFFTPSDFSLRLDKLFNFNFLNSGISDGFANVLLFIPFGLALRFYYSARSIKTLIILCLMSFIFAYSIQICQLWTPSRIPYGGDAIWNLIGSILGVFTFSAFKLNFFSDIKNKWNRDIFLLLAGCLILVDLQPFIPTFDIGFIKENIKGLVFFSDISFLAVIKESLFYFILLNLMQRASLLQMNLLKLAGVLISLVMLQIGIVDSGIDVHVFIGVIMAFLLFVVTRHSLQLDAFIFMILAFIVFNALGSLEYRASVSFNWTPFKPALSGNTLVNIFALLEKSLFYFLYFYLANKASKNRLRSVLSLSLIVFVLEVIQTQIKGATPDITEILVVLVMAWLAWKVNMLDPLFAAQIINKQQSAGLWLNAKDTRIKYFFICLLMAVLAQFVFMSLPQLPYNIAELYNNGGGLAEYACLFLAGFVAVSGIVWIAKGHSVNTISNLKLPVYCAYLSLFTFLLLMLAVTRESIADINGSSNITYQLTGLRIFGEFGYQLVIFFGEQNVKNVSQIVEPFIRFAALTGPFFYFLTLFISFIYKLQTSPSLLRLITELCKSLLLLLPWFFLCKLISFDYSSTDNLNELIAREGAWGIGGGGYLYGLVILTTATIAQIIYAGNRKRVSSVLLAILVFCLSIPISWLLLKNGLIGSFVKYGYTFSGVDFLIGGSRTELLAETELIMRWAIAYSLLLLGVSGAIILAQSIILIKAGAVGTPFISKDVVQPTDAIVKQTTGMNKKLIGLTILLVSGAGAVLFIVTNGLNLSKDHELKIAWAANETNIIFDHHTHSQYSDGNLNIESLVKLANDNGCDAVAITDHTDSKRAISQNQLLDIKKARLLEPNIMVLSGAELNPPSYKGREHVNVLFSPEKESFIFPQLRELIDNKKQPLTDETLFSFLSKQNVTGMDVLGIYNHPSRKDKSENENKLDWLKWNENNQLLIGLSGAPGHQKSADIGSYQNKFKPIHRWDPVVANVGGTLDQLLDAGYDVWGAIASSDYHNEEMDYPPCGFSRIHISAPERTYVGLMLALKKGTFWASHGQFLSQFKLVAEVSENNLSLSPGESGAVQQGNIALIQVLLAREKEYIGLPMDVELITNCVTGKPEALESISVPAFSDAATALIPINQMGEDDQTCYLRSRIKIETWDGVTRVATSNHIRFLLN